MIEMLVPNLANPALLSSRSQPPIGAHRKETAHPQSPTCVEECVVDPGETLTKSSLGSVLIGPCDNVVYEEIDDDPGLLVEHSDGTTC